MKREKTVSALSPATQVTALKKALEDQFNGILKRSSISSIEEGLNSAADLTSILKDLQTSNTVSTEFSTELSGLETMISRAAPQKLLQETGEVCEAWELPCWQPFGGISTVSQSCSERGTLYAGPRQLVTQSSMTPLLLTLIPLSYLGKKNCI